jgi:hypothetical protein
MRTGIATIPLDFGKCPKWLFERMKSLSRAIILAIFEEFGREEILKRLSDPVWFQSLGCTIGFDWNSSGLTTTTLAALKEGIKGLENEIGIFICGGKGKTSRKTPKEIENWGKNLALPKEKIEKLIYSSKISAKVDSCLLQDGYQIYHHNFIFSKEGSWVVLQQGMNEKISKARRYHWLSLNLKENQGKLNFIENPHAAIVSDFKTKPLNLTAKESAENRKISFLLVKEEPKTFLRDLKSILERSNYFTKMELKDIEFYWHPVLKEKFDFQRLKKTIFFANFKEPKDFEDLLATEGVGPKTIRALSLVSELIYGKKPSFEDPARYSFSHGGKDGTPYYPKAKEMDLTIKILERGIKKSKISIKEKLEAQKRLESLKRPLLCKLSL